MKLVLSTFFLIIEIISIDDGCTSDAPDLCKIDPSNRNHVCVKDYSNCDGFEGCTDPARPYLCSDGKCDVNFLKCDIKYLRCKNPK